MTERDPIPGTVVFDGAQAVKGYALNKMCRSFNHPNNRAAFVGDPEGYMIRYGLTERQKRAVRDLSVRDLIGAGGCIYYLVKLTGLHGLTMQDIGAQQTGMTVEAFRDMLNRAED